MSNEMIIKENGGYLAAAINLGDLFSEEMDGLTPTFDRIKIPAGGGISYEVPGDDPSNPDSVKEFKAVILYHHPIHSYYKDKFYLLATDILNRTKTLGTDDSILLLLQRAAVIVPEYQNLHEEIIHYLMEQKRELEMIRYLSQLSRSGNANWMKKSLLV